MLTKIASGLVALVLASNVAVADFARPPVRVESATPIPVVDRAAVEKALLARREHNIASFRRYVKLGVYPHNMVRPGPLNVWRDGDGRLCAAATMIYLDGKSALVDTTADTNNNVRLLDVTGGALLDWMLTSGLTIEEIDRIQEPPLMPDPRDQDPQWQAREDAKLRKDYEATSKWLDAHRTAGMAAAVDRLMAYPKLAQQLVDGKV